MRTILPQFYQLPKAISFVLLFVLFVNMLFMFVMLPTKEARAQMYVEAHIVDDSIATKIWEGLKAAYRAVDAALQKLTSMFSGLTAVTKLWEKADSTAGRLIRAALLVALHRILAMITNEIIKWINGGGTPKFVTDWAGFLRDVAQQAGGDFLNTLAGGFLCNPFAFQIKLALMPTGYYQQSRCTLKDMGRNLQNFFANFTSGGGWGTWLQVSQPNNNFYGLYGMALDEKTRQEAEARLKAQNEALAGGGFLSDKKCMSCTVSSLEGGGTMTFNSMSECESWKKTSGNGVSFKCNREQIMTPASVAQYEVQQAVDSARKLLQDQIAALTPSLGVLTPYITAIAGALINRVIQTGLSAVAQAIGNNDQSYGPTFSNPDIPLPSPEIPPIASTAIQRATEVQSTSPALIVSLNLLKENLEIQLLNQQQKNLAVLNSVKNKQTETLQLLKDMVINNCALPSWVSSQVVGDTGSVQIIKLTANNIGVITIKKTIITTQTGTSTTIEVQETSPAVVLQINALQLNIDETNRWIADVNSALAANRTAMDKADRYSDLYQDVGNSAKSEDIAALSAAENGLKNSYAIALSSSQNALESSEASLPLILADGQEKSVEVIQDALKAENDRAGLESQLSSISSKPAEIQSALNTCIQQNQQAQQQQQQ